MKTVRFSLLLTAVAVAFVSIGAVAQATIIIWSENFSDVSDWQVIFDPGGGSTITSDGNLGLFNVPSANNQAAFGPTPGVAPLVAFDTAKKNDYAMDFTVPSLTDSTSYDIRLDEFDSNTNYLSTVFGVFPQGTFTGTTNVSLGAFSYNGSTVYLLPKITVFTGNPNQTVSFDSMDFSLSVPEPSTAFLFVVGLGMMWHKRRSWKFGK
jgi:hypothetical protein